jgi:hypothetical protein
MGSFRLARLSPCVQPCRNISDTRVRLILPREINGGLRTYFARSVFSKLSSESIIAMGIPSTTRQPRPSDLSPRWARLAAGAAISLAVGCGAASAQSVTFEGSTFTNKGLVGVARVPSNAVDQFGETLGGFGSSMAMDLSTWHKKHDGSYAGTLYMLPDRGWNTQGSVDYRGRLHRFDVKLTPFTGASTTSQNQLQLNYKSSTLFLQAGGQPTTGLDPTGVRKESSAARISRSPACRTMFRSTMKASCSSATAPCGSARNTVHTSTITPGTVSCFM